MKLSNAGRSDNPRLAQMFYPFLGVAVRLRPIELRRAYRSSRAGDIFTTI